MWVTYTYYPNTWEAEAELRGSGQLHREALSHKKEEEEEEKATVIMAPIHSHPLLLSAQVMLGPSSYP